MLHTTVRIDSLFALTQEIFQGVGVPEKDAELVTDNLLTADICGVSSHGLVRVKPYIRRIQSKLTNPAPKMSHRQVGDGMFQVDGDHALGQVATSYALDLCMEQAGKSGSAIAAVNHMNHFGMASYYTKKAARQEVTLKRTHSEPG